MMIVDDSFFCVKFTTPAKCQFWGPWHHTWKDVPDRNGDSSHVQTHLCNRLCTVEPQAPVIVELQLDQHSLTTDTGDCCAKPGIIWLWQAVSGSRGQSISHSSVECIVTSLGIMIKWVVCWLFIFDIGIEVNEITCRVQIQHSIILNDVLCRFSIINMLNACFFCFVR